jgi:predicted hotdog family 3-hydroxylacyl-ACP dehydratase
VEAILAAGETLTVGETVMCRGRVPACSPFASGGHVPAVVALELAAQAVAVQRALSAPASPADGPHRPGYLVAVRNAVFHVDEFPVDAALLAVVSLTGAAGPLAMHDVRVSGPDGATWVTATLSTHAGS